MAVGHLKAVAAPSEREAKLRGYLKDAAGQGIIGVQTGDLAWRAWEELASTFTGLEVPDACPGPDGSLLFTWDRDERHLELEFQPDDAPTFFYADRKTGETWEIAHNAGRSLDTDVKAKLVLFMADG